VTGTFDGFYTNFLTLIFIINIMPAAIDPVIKKQVVKQWLSGDSRDKIAADNNIGTGTVSNIIDEWKKRVQDLEYEPIRELSVFYKKQGITLNMLASCISSK